mmetsp:Transcript_13493/g.46669  ORF Transcript_13493/g.46669 Transcript_13493/m.46669 type:complete len:359 (+) Transcript_13493:1765-2841(+)
MWSVAGDCNRDCTWRTTLHFIMRSAWSWLRTRFTSAVAADMCTCRLSVESASTSTSRPMSSLRASSTGSRRLRVEASSASCAIVLSASSKDAALSSCASLPASADPSASDPSDMRSASIAGAGTSTGTSSLGSGTDASGTGAGAGSVSSASFCAAARAAHGAGGIGVAGSGGSALGRPTRSTTAGGGSSCTSSLAPGRSNGPVGGCGFVSRRSRATASASLPPSASSARRAADAAKPCATSFATATWRAAADSPKLRLTSRRPAAVSRPVPLPSNHSEPLAASASATAWLCSSPSISWGCSAASVGAAFPLDVSWSSSAWSALNSAVSCCTHLCAWRTFSRSAPSCSAYRAFARLAES